MLGETNDNTDVLRYAEIPVDFNLTSYFLDRHIEEGRGDRTAIIADDGPWTYHQLADQTNRVGNVLRELGVRREERVLLALGDSAAFAASWYAIIKVGAVAAEVYTFLQPKDYRYFLEYTRASVAIVDSDTLPKVREAAAGNPHLRGVLVVDVPVERLQGREAHFATLAGQAPTTLEPAPTTRDDIALWKFTTGSTGAPKACVHAMHAPLLSFDWYARRVLNICEDDVVLPVPKMFFGYARDLTMLFPLGVGGAGVLFRERTTPEAIFKLAEAHRPTILVQVPSMMRKMVDHASGNAESLRSLRFCTSAGEALPEELYHEWIERFGVEVLDGIGSSEAYHIYISSRLGHVRAGATGHGVPGYELRIVDEEGSEVAEGETGRLWVEGNTAALMYWNDREKSNDTFAGPVVRTSDLFRRDRDGYYWYQGRTDSLLKVGGIWIAPPEIERCLAHHPAVSECAVVGYEAGGLVRTRAVVALRGDMEGTPERARELQDYVRTHLAPHKYPRDILFVRELPKTGAGKIDRRALQEPDRLRSVAAEEALDEAVNVRTESSEDHPQA